MYIKPHYFFLRNCFQTVLAMSCNTVDEWMLLCQRMHNDVVLQNKVFTSTVTYPNVEELTSLHSIADLHLKEALQLLQNLKEGNYKLIILFYSIIRIMVSSHSSAFGRMSVCPIW